MIRRTCAALLAVASLAVLVTAAWGIEPHGGMLRYPDISATQITFRYANDIWLVPREGGTAVKLSNSPGGEIFPKFSPDGQTIVFTANYDGARDLYTLPIEGGVPERITHHPSQEMPCGWTPDGKGVVFYVYGMGSNPHSYMLYKVSVNGGLPEQLPVPYGTNAAISPDGKWLAYTPFSTDFSTWKRYMGGRAPDIWLFNLKDHSSKKITEWEGSDTFPMWHGDKIYYLSDGGSRHFLNIWVYDTATGERRQVTKHVDVDVKFPSVGPGDHGQGEIVYQLGAELRVLDLGTEKSRVVRVTIPGDRPRIRPQMVDASVYIDDGDVSATGKRAVLSARGDIWSLPAENGSPVDMTRTDGVAERDPSWSPDGKWIAYFSDETGEYELYIKQSDGAGETKRLTSSELGYMFDPTWSPDSKKIAFKDQRGYAYVQDVDGGSPKKFYQSASGAYGFKISWSSDSNWIAFSDAVSPRSQSAIWLYDVANDEIHRVTSGVFPVTWPTFDREGKYLFYASNSDFNNPVYDDVGENWSYPQTDRLYVVTLQDTAKSPFLPEVDTETWEDESSDEADEAKADKGDDGDGEDAEKEDGEDEDEEEPIRIDLDGFEARATLLPVERGAFYNLAVNADGKLFYVRRSGSSRGGGGTSIYLADLGEKDDMEKEVLSGAGQFAMSADGNKILAHDGGRFAIIDAAEGQSWDKTIPTSDMKMDISPPDEWAQMLRDAWRIERDFFYAPNMHGVDWNAIYRKYEAMLPDCASRADLSYIIGELIAELNVGHAYYFGGDYEESPTVSVGMLGCDFEMGDGAYRISKIYQGGPWDADARGPLSEQGVGVSVGDYLLAVNGVPLDPEQDPWAAFQGLAGSTVTLKVSSKPKIDDEARDVYVDLLGSESDLRYRAWVEDRRAYVEEKTDGRVGYIYVPDTGVNGQDELVRQFVGQLEKDALIIDERWNGGGQIPTRFIELLNRQLASYWTMRYIDEVVPTPEYSNYGPKCMLINESAGSGGDYFPYWFKEAGVGKLVGTRTWGGLVGLSGNPGLIDGGYVSVPRFAFVNKDGTWGIEGHGVDPDVEVVDDPALMWNGGDPQLDAAIDLMLGELKTEGFKPPTKPNYPDRSGMGIPPEDY